MLEEERERVWWESVFGDSACVECDLVVAARAREGGGTMYYDIHTHTHTEFVLCLRNTVGGGSN